MKTWAAPSARPHAVTTSNIEAWACRPTRSRSRAFAASAASCAWAPRSKALDGLEAANANLLGEVTLSWDDERLAHDDILQALARAGFRPAATAE